MVAAPLPILEGGGGGGGGGQKISNQKNGAGGGGGGGGGGGVLKISYQNNWAGPEQKIKFFFFGGLKF